MKLRILAVGRGRGAPEDELTQDFLTRARAIGPKLGFTAIDLVIVETSKGASVSARMADEETRLLAQIPRGSQIIALDEGAKAVSSEGFAKDLAKRRDQGEADLVFLIGGPDGLSPALRSKEKLSFGPQTWPHLLVRAMLTEQIYRALTILSGHPYHRGRAG